MNPVLKRHIINIMAPRDHKHLEMSQAFLCSSCGVRMKKAEKFYKEQLKKTPKEWIRKAPEYPDSPELNQMRTQLADRLKRDPMYKKHIELSFKGTSSERKRENVRANRGFYTRHSNYQAKKYV